MNTHTPRIVFATIAIVFALASTEVLNAQNFKQSGKTPAELYTKKSNSMISAQGDFDKDGKKDLVIAVNQDYTDVGDGTDFAFYFGNAQGGYTLARAPEAISVGEVLKALEGSTALVDCVGTEGSDCGNVCTCAARPLWLKLQRRIDDVLDSTTIRDMADDYAQQRGRSL